MAGIASVSRTQLAQRRQKLRRQRQLKIFQALWRTLAVSSLAGGLLWVTTQPIWVLSAPKQIVISGNQLLSDQAIGSLLTLSYPQSLWRIEPSAVAVSLEAQPPIAEATVSRRLFPPGLVVHVKERVPVAIAQPPLSQNSSSPTTKVPVGLLDPQGVWMPIESYTSLSSNLKLPNLKVIGLPAQYRSYWVQLYQAVTKSPVKVREIDCQDPANLILKTELGIVHIGSYSSQLPEQLKVLAQMRQLPAQINPSKIDYIDLKNPESPLVQMNQTSQEATDLTP